MVNVLAIAPTVVLILAALLALPARLTPRLRSLLAAGALLSSAILLQLNFTQSNDPQPLLAAPPLAENLELTLSFDGAALLFSYVLLAAALALILLQGARSGSGLAGLLVSTAGAISFFCADNWPTLAAAWLLADGGLVLMWSGSPPSSLEPGSGPSLNSRLRALAISQMGVIFFLAAGALAASFGSSLRLDEVALGGVAATLVFVAAWSKSGMWPFHIAFAPELSTESEYRTWGLGITSLLGGYLLVRALFAFQGEMDYAALLNALVLIGVAATGLVVLADERPTHIAAWVAQIAGVPLLLLPFVGSFLVRPALGIWLALALFNSLAIVAGASVLRAQTRRQPWVQLIWFIGILIAAGFPFTPGFLGRVGLYAAAMQDDQFALVLALAASMTLALTALWRVLFQARGEEERRPSPVELMGILLLLVPVLAEGIAPFRVLALFGRATEDAGVIAYDVIFHSSNLLITLAILGAVILPVPLSFMLARAWAPLHERMGWLRTVGSALELSWLVRAGAPIFESIGVGLRQIGNLVEQHPIGWLLFAAIWIALWILNVRAAP